MSISVLSVIEILPKLYCYLRVYIYVDTTKLNNDVEFYFPKHCQQHGHNMYIASLQFVETEWVGLKNYIDIQPTCNGRVLRRHMRHDW